MSSPLFAASGAAALIYEIAWFQLLQLVIGSTAVSMAVLLAAFLGGMCTGSLLLPRIAMTSSCSGGGSPGAIDVTALRRRRDAPAYAAAAASLRGAGFSGVNTLLGTYAGRAADLRDWLEGATINGDATCGFSTGRDYEPTFTRATSSTLTW